MSAAPRPLPGIALALPWRVLAAALATVSRGSLLLLAFAAWFGPALMPSGTLLRAVALLCFVPGLAAWTLRRAHATTMAVEGGALVLRGRTGRVEIPLGGIAGVLPWRVPLPAPGLWLRLRSGERLPEGLAPDDPGALLHALADAGVSEEVVGRAARHPATRYASAKSAARWRIDHPLVKFVLFALVPAVPLFRLRQYLAYGGGLGEYYQFGLQAYLLGFGVYWLLYAVYLLLYAAVLRACTEAASFAAAWIAPARAPFVRRAAETAHRILYYAGVPAVLVLRLYPW